MNLKKSGEICKILRITPTTLNRWVKLGKINCQKINARKFLYDLDSVISCEKEKRMNVIYARVSSSSQKEDLKRQVEFIKQYMISNGIIPDLVFEEIASGMNENRSELNELIDIIINGKVDTVYISYKDRLTRFGFDYFKNLFEKFNTRICTINLTKEEDFQNELTQDLISILHHFSMKFYSQRKNLLKKFKTELENINITE